MASYYEAPTLEHLVDHFVAAKRSLSSTTHVYRANEIVHGARGLVEQSAVLRAKNTHLRSGVAEQIHLLDSVHGGLDSVGREAEVDFKAVIARLDLANDRLQTTLSSLRTTIVKTDLSNSQSATSDDRTASVTVLEEQEEQSGRKTLHDFIDESTHLALLDSLRATIDSYNDASASLEGTRSTFADSIHELNSRVREVDDLMTTPSHLLVNTTAGYDVSNDSVEHDYSSIPSLFHSLTSHAAETASLLQSLISHYDLCVTALKHTEGGSAAARRATISNPTTKDAEADATMPVEESLYASQPGSYSPISPSDRTEMLQVLANDSAEVSDVVSEIASRISEMESQLQLLSAHANTARSVHKALDRVLRHLSSISSSLTTHVTAARSFRQTWTALRTDIVTKTEELASLTSFYDSFVASYRALLREVERRNMVETKMAKIADKARRDIEALYCEDVDMREQFVKDVGEFLPKDIWPGLVDRPERWVIRPIAWDEEDAQGMSKSGAGSGAGGQVNHEGVDGSD